MLRGATDKVVTALVVSNLELEVDLVLVQSCAPTYSLRMRFGGTALAVGIILGLGGCNCGNDSSGDLDGAAVDATLFDGTAADAANADAAGAQWLHVDDDSTATAPDGRTWATAFRTIQDALDVASAGQEIWVARGVYRASVANAPVATMIDGVVLLGGFVGDEVSLAGRPDPLGASGDSERTILDGDVSADGNPALDDLATVHDNSFHVIVAANNTTIDGLTIRNGAAVDYAREAPVDLCPGSTVPDPTDLDPDLRGGGMTVVDAHGVTVRKTRFENNGAFRSGGAIHCNTGTVTVTDSTFINNDTTALGGAIHARICDVTIAASNISDSDAAQRGGALTVSGSRPECPTKNDPAGILTVTDSVFTNNNSDRGGAISARDGGTVVVTDVVFDGNGATSLGGAISAADSTVTLVDAAVLNNTATRGAGLFQSGGSVVIANSRFDLNTGDTKGGGVNLLNVPTATLTNVLLSRNQSTTTTGTRGGGGMFIENSTVTMTNLTFYQNSAVRFGGAVFAELSTIAVRNTAYAQNTAGNAGDNIYDDGTSTISEDTPCVDAPVEEGTMGEVFLIQTGAGNCVGGGSEVFANDPVTGFVATGGVHWSSLTTSSAGELDADGAGATDVDRGAHY